jgi:importin subunit alpha-1
MKRYHKKGFDSHNAKKRRDDDTIQLRRRLKDDNLFKKRSLVPTHMTDTVPVIEIQTTDDETETKTCAPVPGCSDTSNNSVSSVIESVKAIYSTNSDTQLDGLQTMRRMLSVEKGSPIQAVVDTGVIPRIVSYMSDDENPTAQFQAAWIISNICSSLEEKHIDVVVQSGAIPSLVSLLFGDCEKLCEQSILALGNIAAEINFRKNITDNCPLEKLVERASNLSPRTIKQLAWFVCVLFVHKKTDGTGYKQLPCKQVEKIMLFLTMCICQYHENNEILRDTLTTMQVLADRDEYIKLVLDTRLEGKFVEFCLHKDPKIQLEAVTLVGHIVSGTNTQTRQIIQAGAILAWKTILCASGGSGSAELRKRVLWSISNVLFDSEEHITEVLKVDGVALKMLEILHRDEYKCKREVAWGIYHICKYGNDAHVKYLMDLHYMMGLGSCLSATTDADTLRNCLEILKRMFELYLAEISKSGTKNIYSKYAEEFEAAGGWDLVTKLGAYENEEISDLASALSSCHDRLDKVSDDIDMY